VNGLPSDQDHSGRTFGDEELDLLAKVIASGVLNSTKGTQVSAMEQEFAAMLGGGVVVACNSGSAAVHTAVAAVDPEPGEEIIVSPVTDVGGVAPVLWQGAIPVFADIDPASLNVTAESVAARITPRTRAVVVTHLLGHPADIVGIAEVVRAHGLMLIEDCAQAYGATVDGRPVGTFGDIACFSLQQTKHISTGEGGMVLASGARAERVHQFVNKARVYSDPVPEHHFLAMNYRMTELQGAVGLAQLRKLPSVVARRQASGDRFVAALADVPGATVTPPAPGARHSYWKMAVHVDPAVVPGGMPAVAKALAARGYPVMAGYQRPAYTWRFIAERRTFGRSGYPFTLATAAALDHAPDRFPGVEAGLANVVVLPWNEHYADSDVDSLAGAICEITTGKGQLT
jgi:perosamine synthetase